LGTNLDLVSYRLSTGILFSLVDVRRAGKFKTVGVSTAGGIVPNQWSSAAAFATVFLLLVAAAIPTAYTFSFRSAKLIANGSRSRSRHCVGRLDLNTPALCSAPRLVCP
jgi:hypothetical protein